MRLGEDQTSVHFDRILPALSEIIVSADSDLLSLRPGHTYKHIPSKADDNLRVNDIHKPPEERFTLTQPALPESAGESSVPVAKSKVGEKEVRIISLRRQANSDKQRA